MLSAFTFPRRHLLLLLITAALLSTTLPGWPVAPPVAQAQTAGDPIVVPADWPLNPSGALPGDRFRLIYVATARAVQSSDIGLYNKWVQTHTKHSRAHASIKPYADFFSVVASTATVDARENTGMHDGSAFTDGSTTATDPGVSVHWLGGAKVADNYFDFYDGSWSNEDAPKYRPGSDAPVDAAGYWTGSNNNGTAASDSLGMAQVVRGLLNDGTGNPLSGGGSQPSSRAKGIYAMSPFFEVGPGPLKKDAFGDYVVGPNWGLLPSGLTAGDRFRLIFVTSGTRDATATDIAVYNEFVQDTATASTAHEDLQPVGRLFKAVASSAGTDARLNTGMYASGRWNDGSSAATRLETTIPTYWVNGNRVVNNYFELYGDEWLDESGATNEAGTAINPTALRVWTGTIGGDRTTGRGEADPGAELGKPELAVGSLNDDSSGTAPIKATGRGAANSESHPLYAISPVFRVAGGADPTVVAGPCQVGFDYAHPGWRDHWVLSEDWAAGNREGRGAVPVPTRQNGLDGGVPAEIPVSLSGDCSALGQATVWDNSTGTATSKMVDGVPVQLSFIEDDAITAPSLGNEFIGFAEKDMGATNAIIAHMPDDDLFELDKVYPGQLEVGFLHDRYGADGDSGWRETDPPSGVVLDTDRADTQITVTDDEVNWVTELSNDAIDFRRALPITGNFKVHIRYDKNQFTTRTVVADATKTRYTGGSLSVSRSRTNGVVLALGDMGPRFKQGTHCGGNLPVDQAVSATSAIILANEGICNPYPRSSGAPDYMTTLPYDDGLPILTIEGNEATVNEGGIASFTVTAHRAVSVDTQFTVTVVVTHGDTEVNRSRSSTKVIYRTRTKSTETDPDPPNLGGPSIFGRARDVPDETHAYVEAFIEPPGSGQAYHIGMPSSARTVIVNDVPPPADGLQTSALQDPQTNTGYIAPAALVTKLRSYAAETEHGQTHVDRWKSALEGLCVEDYDSISPMTAAQAQINKETYTATRWGEVVTELTKAEAQGCPAPDDGQAEDGTQTEQSEDETPPPVVCTFTATDSDLVSLVRSYHDANKSRSNYSNNWLRVLIAFGEETSDTLTPLTVAEAKTGEQIWSGWTPIREELERLEQEEADCAAKQASTTPGVTISGGSAITEGGNAVFTLTASPKPAADISVKVDITQSGSYATSTAQRTVTIGTSGTATLNIATTADSTDEPNGSITATIASGTGYTGSGSATVTVNDDDPTPIGTPAVSITGGSAVTEGGNAVFTLTASPKPSASISVKVDITQSGSFAASTAQRTVTIGTSGTAMLKIATTNDNLDEANGSVTATIASGAGYTGSGSATVTVSDNDVPAVSIAAGSAVTEGAAATFTLTASPKPASSISVKVNVTQSGSYATSTAQRTVTIGTSGTATLNIATTADSTDEPNGSITATIASGTGYTGSGSATVTVKDDDEPAGGSLIDRIKKAEAKLHAGSATKYVLSVVRQYLEGTRVGYPVFLVRMAAEWHADADVKAVVNEIIGYIDDGTLDDHKQ